MIKPLGALLALSWLLACDAVVGSEPCTGAAHCEDPPASLAVSLRVQYVRVSTESAIDLPIVSSTASPCSGQCAEPVRLFRANGDAVWTLSRMGGLPTLKLLQGSGANIDVAISAKEPEGGATLSSLFVSAVPGGSAVAHVSWELPRGNTYDELTVVEQPGQMSHLPLVGKTRQPRGAIRAPQGFLLFDAVAQRQSVEPAIPTGSLRLVDANGATLWQQGRLPSFASAVGSSAVALADGFVVGAAEGTEPSAKAGVLSLDSTGMLTRFGLSGDSSWHGARLVSLAQGAYAVAAESDIDGVVDGTGKGNIDVMIDRGDPNALTGFRLERFCVYELALHGFSADDAGNLYVSTVTGEKGSPRGLICELPLTGPARCFQGAPNQQFGEIVATGGGALFVAAGDAILRAQIPPLSQP